MMQEVLKTLDCYRIEFFPMQYLASVYVLLRWCYCGSPLRPPEGKAEWVNIL